MRNWCIFLLLLLYSISCDFYAASIILSDQVDPSPTKKIAVISDVHYLSPQLIEKGVALTYFENATGRNTKENHAVLQEVLLNLEHDAPHVLLITGDLTNHGERQSHLDFIKLLKPIQDAGTQIFVIPGNHDVHIPDAKAYKGESQYPVEGISSHDFIQLYRDHGYNNTLNRDNSSLSYLAELDAKLWLLAIDSNRHQEYNASSISAGRILPETLEWALKILREANEKGITVVGMMHHGLVEHMPFQESFFPNYIVEDWKKVASRLADAGLRIIFTGHFHANDITLFTSPAGNMIYDVETASMVQYPFAYRLMELEGDKISIDTRYVTSIPGNNNLEDTARKRLEMVTSRMAKNKLNASGLPIPEMMKNNLHELIVELYLVHVRGDEVLNENLQEMIKHFAEMMGVEAESESFAFDFPPEDNKVILSIGKE